MVPSSELQNFTARFIMVNGVAALPVTRHKEGEFDLAAYALDLWNIILTQRFTIEDQSGCARDLPQFAKFYQKLKAYELNYGEEDDDSAEKVVGDGDGVGKGRGEAASLMQASRIMVPFDLHVLGTRGSKIQAVGLQQVGARMWDSGTAYGLTQALALLQYFEEQKMSFVQKKVIELGSGTGILGILTVLLGGDVTITDKPEVLKQMEWNVAVNIPSSCRSRIKVRALSWGYDHTLFPSDYDYVLCADIMYDFASFPLILKTLLHLSNEKTIIYFASTMSMGYTLINSGYQFLSQHFNSKLVYRNEAKDVRVYKMTKMSNNDLV
ncbi:EEF1A lysine methyltransferase 3-like [Cetorhinus maximus]